MNNEPVAWMVNDKLYKDIFEAEHYSKFTNKPIIPLYTYPTKTLTNSEQDACFNRGYKEGARDILNKQAKTLTDEEIIDIADTYDWHKDCAIEFARAILRKAQEK